MASLVMYEPSELTVNTNLPKSVVTFQSPALGGPSFSQDIKIAVEKKRNKMILFIANSFIIKTSVKFFSNNALYKVKREKSFLKEDTFAIL